VNPQSEEALQHMCHHPLSCEYDCNCSTSRCPLVSSITNSSQRSSLTHSSFHIHEVECIRSHCLSSVWIPRGGDSRPFRGSTCICAPLPTVRLGSVCSSTGKLVTSKTPDSDLFQGPELCDPLQTQDARHVASTSPYPGFGRCQRP
jgi:hypothetical protein